MKINIVSTPKVKFFKNKGAMVMVNIAIVVDNKLLVEDLLSICGIERIIVGLGDVC